MNAIMKKLDPKVLPATEASHRATLMMPRRLSQAEQDLLLGVGRPRDLETHDLVFRRGELGRSMFVVESGEIRLEFGEGLPDKVLGPAEFFGELALFIGNHQRVATATATRRTRLFIIEHVAFEELMTREPNMMADFMRRSFAYLVASEQALIASLRRRNEDLQVTLDSLRSTQKQLDTAERLIQTDELTGLFNRRGLYAYLDRYEASSDSDSQLGLLLVDLDRFKQINDHYGHLRGDDVLRAVAQEIQNAALPTDLPVRLGGDEFALLLIVGSIEELEARAGLISGGVRGLRFTTAEGDDLKVTVSIGGCMCNRETSWSSWYADADGALYGIKDGGGDALQLQSGNSSA